MGMGRDCKLNDSRTKQVIILICAIIILCGCIQHKEKYGVEFNEIRMQIGLPPLPENWKTREVFGVLNPTWRWTNPQDDSIPYYFKKSVSYNKDTILEETNNFMFSGTSLLKNENHSWSLLMLSSIGILTSCGWLYFYGFIFRTTPLDLFFLEIPSFILIFLFNVNCFIKKIGIIVPHNRWILIFIFMLINFALNQCAWWFLQSSNY